MNQTRRAGSVACWTLQWSLALILFLGGLLEASLSPGRPGGALLVSVAAVAMVVPSACRFLPVVAPLAATLLAFLLAVGPGTPSALVLAAGCLLVAVARGLLVPIDPSDFHAERQDPLRTGAHPVAARRPGARRPSRLSLAHQRTR